VEPEDVVHVLRNMVDAVKLGGIVLDLQVIRPNPLVELDGRVLCEIDGEPLFRQADAATAAVDALVVAGRLVEQAVDDHAVRKHYVNGAALVDDFADKQRRLPRAAVRDLLLVDSPCVVRERCRLRRLKVRGLQIDSWRTDRMLPAGSVNQAMYGPTPRAIPFSS
jgi:hypothetical protein